MFIKESVDLVPVLQELDFAKTPKALVWAWVAGNAVIVKNVNAEIPVTLSWYVCVYIFNNYFVSCEPWFGGKAYLNNQQ